MRSLSLGDLCIIKSQKQMLVLFGDSKTLNQLYFNQNEKFLFNEMSTSLNMTKMRRPFYSGLNTSVRQTMKKGKCQNRCMKYHCPPRCGVAF